MRKALILVFFVASPLFAQGVDDCPPGHARHPALTGLDPASMDAAITASFVGLFGRQPSRVPGSGSDDIAYWIRAEDHYGLYSDDVCRAGHNLYREKQLGNQPTGPWDADLPARFQPGANPPTIPSPSPAGTPAPVPSADLGPILAQLSVLAQSIVALEAEDRADAAATQAKLDDVQASIRPWKDLMVFLTKYVVPAATAFLVAKGWVK